MDFPEQEIILRYGCFNSLVLDKHPVYSSIAALREMTEKYRFELKFNPRYSHSATGLSEIVQKTVQQIIKFYIQNDVKSWGKYVPYAVFSINSKISRNTTFSPYFLMHGFYPRTITDAQYDIKLSLQITREKLNDIRQKIVDKLFKTHLRQKRHDADRNQIFQENDKVLIYMPDLISSFHIFHCKFSLLSMYTIQRLLIYFFTIS